MITSNNQIRSQSSPVVVAIHPDGFVEVYGHRDIDVQIVNVPAADSKRGEQLAEEYVEINLPPRHRAIYAAGMVQAMKMGRVITPQEIYETRRTLSMLRALDTKNFITSLEASA